MAKKKVTLETLAAQMQKGFAAVDAKIGDLDERMKKGFASLDAKIDKLDKRMERGFAAVADDIAAIKREMATKDDARDIIRAELATIRTDLKDIKTRLKDVEEKVDTHAGFAKEVDHVLSRISYVEKHLGLIPQVGA